MSQGTSPDLSVIELPMARKNNSATILYHMKVNKILGKVKSRGERVTYGQIGVRELQEIGMEDVSYKIDENAIVGILLIIANKSFIEQV